MILENKVFQNDSYEIYLESHSLQYSQKKSFAYFYFWSNLFIFRTHHQRDFMTEFLFLLDMMNKKLEEF